MRPGTWPRLLTCAMCHRHICVRQKIRIETPRQSLPRLPAKLESPEAIERRPHRRPPAVARGNAWSWVDQGPTESWPRIGNRWALVLSQAPGSFRSNHLSRAILTDARRLNPAQPISRSNPSVGNDPHNHPSDDPSPSAADIQLTRQLREAAAAVDIPLLDHVLIGRRGPDPPGRGYYSLLEHDPAEEY